MFARPAFFKLTCLLMSVLVLSCEDEAKNNRVLLNGRWEIVKGFRNNRETETLSGTYFEFEADGKMKTNLPIGPEEPIDYEVNQNEIRQKSTPPVKYLIQNLSDSALILALELRGMQFVLHLQRAQEEIPPSNSPDTSLLPVDTLPGNDNMQQ